MLAQLTTDRPAGREEGRHTNEEDDWGINYEQMPAAELASTFWPAKTAPPIFTYNQPPPPHTTIDRQADFLFLRTNLSKSSLVGRES